MELEVSKKPHHLVLFSNQTPLSCRGVDLCGAQIRLEVASGFRLNLIQTNAVANLLQHKPAARLHVKYSEIGDDAAEDALAGNG